MTHPSPDDNERAKDGPPAESRRLAAERSGLRDGGGQEAPAHRASNYEERLRGEGRYRVDLTQFAGPLDLLLYLIRENEVEITDIPVATITDQFLTYMKGLPSLDLDQAGEFLLMASTLMEIKSRMLLPAQPDGEEGEGIDAQELDPRWELVQQLLEYRTIKGQALLLEKRLAARAGIHPPGGAVSVGEAPEEEQEGKEPVPVGPVEILDLVRAFARILRETSAGSSTTITYDDVPVAVHIDRLMTRLEGAPAGTALSFFALARERLDRPWVVGLFLAVLELVKLGRVRVTQADEGGDIGIRLGDPARDGVPGGTDEGDGEGAS